MRVNLGCGQAYMEGWVNVDPSPDVKADIYLDAADFVRQYGHEVDEVYMGHVLEHILPGDALVTLRLLCERLPAGAVVSAVTPDMSAIFAAYQRGEISNDQLNASFIYSYVQPSHHVWCYDVGSLTELFQRAGFDDITPVDPLSWPPVFHKEGPEARWQCGVKASAKGAPVADRGPAPAVATLTLDAALGQAEQSPQGPHSAGPVTTEELLLRRVELLRAELLREAGRRAELERRVTELGPAGPAAPAADSASEQEVGAERGSSPAPVGATQLTGQVPWKSRLKTVAKQRLPEGSTGREVAKAGLRSLQETREFRHRMRQVWNIPGVREAAEPSYGRWLRQHVATPAQLDAQREASAAATRPVRFHMLVVGGGGSLADTVASVQAQSWAHWRLSVCQPDTPSPSRDNRVEVVPEPPSLPGPGSAGAHTANLVTEASDADFVIVLKAGDLLAPECLYTVAMTVHQDPLLDLVYWDDDRVNGRGRRVEPRFRPSWSPDMLLSANYLGRSFAVRRARLRLAGGLRYESRDAMHWDLVLRCWLDDERVARISRVLASVGSREGAATVHGQHAVQDHLDRLGLPGTAALEAGTVRVSWQLTEPPQVTVVIPTRHNRRMLRTCLPSLARTDYPCFDVVVVDNGGRSADNERWYRENDQGLDLDVLWWDVEPFNYSAVNNAAVAHARAARDGATQSGAEVLVFLNDDTEVLDPGWLRELVGWVSQPEIGCAGLQLVGPAGEIQHAGAILGLSGFADHVFEGMRPGSDSLLGSTRWNRDLLAVTGACLAVRGEVFDELGGFDERFVLTGSDVALGLDARLRGYRNVCSALVGLRHLESATRGSSIPQMDFFTSYWRYSSWLFGGDPYFSPSLSLGSRRPALRAETEPTPAQRLEVPLGRSFRVFRQKSDAAESRMLADMCRALPVDTAATLDLHARNAAAFDVRTINWFIPDIDSPFYGGINSALRMADHLARHDGVQNRFVVWGSPPDFFVRSALAAAFPSLADSEIVFYDGYSGAGLESLPPADAAIATLWVTAYAVAHAPNVKRKFYLIQDFEPMFYPASTLYALAEETYRLGLYGLCNTENLLRIYREDYGGTGMSFMPAVDQSVFHADGRHQRTEEAPVTVFVYARPGHWRNCWELASLALEELKARLGDRVRILTAGSWATGAGADNDIRHLGLLDYRATGELYRNSDVGLALTVSKHPSYLPLELMACGVPVVAFDNPWGHWILRDGENCLLAKRTADSLADRLERLCVDGELRRRLSARGLEDIAAHHSSWEKALSGIHGYLCDPEGTGAR